MKKTIFTCCLLASAVVFSSSLYATEEECNENYIRETFARSKWQGNKLIDTAKGYSYTVLDLATNKEVGASPQSRQDLAVGKIQFTKFDPTANSCTVTLLRENGGNLSVKLIPQKLTGTS